MLSTVVLSNENQTCRGWEAPTSTSGGGCHNNDIQIYCKVSTILSCSYLKETIGGVSMPEVKMEQEEKIPACPVETTLMLISDKWKVLILRDLLPGTKRFGELRKSIGHVSQKVLTAQLRQMEASGLLTRKVYAEVPPRVEYTLTELGYSLKPILDAMSEWGENYQNMKEKEV
jgi:DNA-binding HxlR family transcriptional regulator